MSETPAQRSAGLATTGVLMATAAALGTADIALHGVGLDPSTSAATVILWLTLAALPATAAGVAAGVLARALRGRVPAHIVEVDALACLLLLLAIACVAQGWLGFAGAAACSMTTVGLHALLRRRADWTVATPGLAVAAVIAAPLVAAGLGQLRFDPPRLPAASHGAPAAAVDRPHVVLVVLDTLRADHLGAYGSTAGLSPAFDALASQGTLYEQCYAPASWTVPSHASLFTGLHPRTHGASFAQHRWLDDEFATLAESLRETGYRTAAFSANAHVGLANLDQGFELYREIGSGFRELRIRKLLAALGAPARWIDQGAAQGVREIERFLDDVGGESAPVFLFVNLLEPHWRHLPPLAERRATLPRGMSYFESTRRSARFYGPLEMARSDVGDGRTRAAIRGLYAAEVRYQDAWLERLVFALDGALGEQDTLLIITSDHGENLGEGGRWDHVFAINDHLIHVPMLLRRPGSVPIERRDDALCQLVDVPTTVAAAVGGLSLDPRASGHSLLGAPGEALAGARRHAFAEGDPYLGHLERMSFHAGFERDVARFAATLHAVHDGRFKYVTSTRAEPALYDLANDPDELHDVRLERPERAAELAAVLQVWLRSQPEYTLDVDPRADSGAGGLAPGERERLESPGDVQ